MWRRTPRALKSNQASLRATGSPISFVPADSPTKELPWIQPDLRHCVNSGFCLCIARRVCPRHLEFRFISKSLFLCFSCSCPLSNVGWTWLPSTGRVTVSLRNYTRARFSNPLRDIHCNTRTQMSSAAKAHGRLQSSGCPIQFSHGSDRPLGNRARKPKLPASTSLSSKWTPKSRKHLQSRSTMQGPCIRPSLLIL